MYVEIRWGDDDYDSKVLSALQPVEKRQGPVSLNPVKKTNKQKQKQSQSCESPLVLASRSQFELMSG
jgi:hypothetical protein